MKRARFPGIKVRSFGKFLFKRDDPTRYYSQRDR
jgi:hypothetical protein